ncbi:MAG TPA: FecR family protein [Anaerolineales bacterium]
MLAKYHRLIISFILMIFTLLAACQPQATAQPTPGLALTATIKEVTGTASIKQPGDSSFSPASLGTQLQPKGEIQTGDDGRVRLDLSTGTIIRVAPSSLFTLTSNQPSNGSLTTQLNLSLGGIFIILSGGNASVNTPSGVASVRGSYLSVYIDPTTQNITVTCLEGHCGAGNSAGNTDFGTGQEVVLFSCAAGQCTVPGVGPMTPQDFQNWINNNPDLQLPGLSATMTALVSTEPPATLPPASTATLTPTAEACLDIIGPDKNADLAPTGTVTFDWKPKDGASQYELTILYPNGASSSFYTDKTSITRYLESMPAGGTYTWFVTVFDSANQQICQTDQSTFSKPKFETPVPKNPEPASTQPPVTPPPVTQPPATQPPAAN